MSSSEKGTRSSNSDRIINLTISNLEDVLRQVCPVSIYYDRESQFALVGISVVWEGWGMGEMEGARRPNVRSIVPVIHFLHRFTPNFGT